MFTDTDMIFLALNVTSIILVGLVAFFFVRFYKYFRSFPLESIVVGFGILVVSYSFATAYQVLQLAPGIRVSLLLLTQLSLKTLAFSFIAAGFVLWKQEKSASRMMILLTSIMIFVVVIVILSALMLSGDAMQSLAAKMEYFHGVNFVLLAFVAAKSFRNYVRRPETRSSMVPAAFAILAVGQYSLFIWSVDSGQTSLVFGAICRVIGFVLFLLVVFKQRSEVINE